MEPSSLNVRTDTVKNLKHPTQIKSITRTKEVIPTVKL